MKQSIFLGIAAVLGVLVATYLLGMQFGTPRTPTGGHRIIRYVAQIEDYSFEFSSRETVGAKMHRPEDPTHERYTFDGWYRVQNPDTTTDTAWDFEASLWGGPPLTLYAAWKPVTYTVKFVDGGWTLKTQEIAKGGKVEPPVLPDNPGSIISGWIDTNTGLKWDFENDVVTEQVNLQVQWVVDLRFFDAGASTSYLLDNSGTVWAWGKEINNRPINILGFTDEDTIRYNSIFAGGNSLLAIDVDGYLWSTGNNESGQLGLGTISPFFSQFQPLNIQDPDNPPTIITIPADPENPDSEERTETIPNYLKFVTAAVGTRHAMAIDERGNLWAWGANDYGQLGDSTVSETPDAMPKLLDHGGRHYEKVFVYDSHTYAIDEDGSLWAWGRNNFFQLARPASTVSSSVPLQIMAGTEFDSVKTSGAGIMAITKEGTLYVWGIHANNYEPRDMGGELFASIAVGPEYYVALTREGKLYGWAFGENKVAPVVDGEIDNFDGLSMRQLFPDMTFTWLEGGDNHLLALDIDGNLWAWGANSDGQLGNDSTNDSDNPILVEL